MADPQVPSTGAPTNPDLAMETEELRQLAAHIGSGDVMGKIALPDNLRDAASPYAAAEGLPVTSISTLVGTTSREVGTRLPHWDTKVHDTLDYLRQFLLGMAGRLEEIDGKSADAINGLIRDVGNGVPKPTHPPLPELPPTGPAAGN